VKSVASRRVRVTVVGEGFRAGALVPVTLAQALLKSDKMDRDP
jgi:hypothetical protein